MSRNRFTASALRKLSKHKQELIVQLMCTSYGMPSFKDIKDVPEFVKSVTTEGIVDCLDLWIDNYFGCVPGGYEEVLMEIIIRKFRRPVEVAINDSIRRLNIAFLNGLSYTPEPYVLVEPSYEHEVQMVIVDSKIGIQYYSDMCKPWNFKFVTLAELAEHIECISDTLLRRYELFDVAAQHAIKL